MKTKKLLFGLTLFLFIIAFRFPTTTEKQIDSYEVQPENIMSYNMIQTLNVSSNEQTVVSPGDIEKQEEDNDLIFTEKEIRTDYQLYCCKQQIKNLEAMIFYCDVQKLELEQRKTMEQVKYEQGYSVQSNVTIIENQIEILELEAQNLYNEKEFQLKKIIILGGEYTEGEINEELPELQGDFLSLFVAKDTQLKLYDQQIKTYQNYLDALDEADDSYAWIKSQKETLESNRRENYLQLELHVEQMIKNYENTRREIQEYDYQIANLEIAKNNNELLYEEGQIAKADLLSSDAEIVKLQTEKQKKISAAQIIYYELNSGIVLSQ